MATPHTIELWSGYTVLERELEGFSELVLLNLDLKNGNFNSRHSILFAKDFFGFSLANLTLCFKLPCIKVGDLDYKISRFNQKSSAEYELILELI